MALELILARAGWGGRPVDAVAAELRAGSLVRLRSSAQVVGTLSLMYPTMRGPTPFGLLARERLAPTTRLKA